jgi:excisionase family DNA binding protein
MADLLDKAPPRAALAFTLSEASAQSGLSVSTLRRLAKRGKLHLLRVGGRTLVGGDSLRRLLGVQNGQ